MSEMPVNPLSDGSTPVASLASITHQMVCDGFGDVEVVLGLPVPDGVGFIGVPIVGGCMVEIARRTPGDDEVVSRRYVLFLDESLLARVKGSVS